MTTITNIPNIEVHYAYSDMQNFEIKRARAHNLAADPGTVAEGLYYWNTATKKWRVYNGTTWEDLGGGGSGIDGTLFDAKGEIIVGTGNDTYDILSPGANGTFLVAASGETTGLEWRTLAEADIPAVIARDSEVLLQSAANTKGDLPVATGDNAWGILPAGANDHFLVGASGQATGLQYRAIVSADITGKLALADLTDWPPTTDLDVNGQKVVNAADATSDAGLATWGQVKSFVNGLDMTHPSVKAATNGALPAYTRTVNNLQANANGAFPQVDGVTIDVGESFLLKDGAAGEDNGPYTLTDAGSAGTPWTATRRATEDVSAEVTPGLVLVVEQGTNFDNRMFVLATNGPIVLNTTALTFTVLPSPADLIAGGGLTATGNTWAVVAGTTLGTAGPGGGLKVNGDDVVVDRDRVTVHDNETIGDGAETEFDIAHDSGRVGVPVTVVKVSDGSKWCPGISYPDANTARVTFVGYVPAADEFLVQVG